MALYSWLSCRCHSCLRLGSSCEQSKERSLSLWCSVPGGPYMHRELTVQHPRLLVDLPSCGGAVTGRTNWSGSRWRRCSRGEVHGSPFPPAPHASSSRVAPMPLLQSLKNQRDRERRKAKAQQEVGTGPESNPVRTFSPGSSCTPLWFPANGCSAAVVLFVWMAGDFWQGKLKPCSASASLLHTLMIILG